MAFRWLENLRELFTRERGDDDLAREVRSHLDEETEEQIDRGVPPEEAPYAARRAFGNVTRVEERTREAWRGEGIASSLREFAGGVVQDALDRRSPYQFEHRTIAQTKRPTRADTVD